MKTTRLVSALAASLGLGLALAPSLSPAQDKKPTELRYTSGAPPTGNPWVMQTNRFAKNVEEESKNELKIQPFFGSQLGSEQDTVQQVARGRIDMGGFSTGSAALVVPEITLLTMPGYFRDVQEQDCVLDNHMVKVTTELFEKKGVRFLGWTEVGAVELFGKKAFVAPKDMNGVKAAAYANKTQTVFYGSLGATAIPLGLPEWIPAFQTGMAEAVLTVITYALPSGLTKVAPVVTRNGLSNAPGITLMNKAVFDKLPKAQQEALTKASERVPSSQYRAEIRGFESTLYGMMEKAGGQVAVLTPEQREVWRKTLEPNQPRQGRGRSGRWRQSLFRRHGSGPQGLHQITASA